jgi:hypothetical protein
MGGRKRPQRRPQIPFQVRFRHLAALDRTMLAHDHAGPPLRKSKSGA